ncbi:MAG TPA: hypothetical protein VE195_06195 [Acidobacteriaceae bacterium]|nr:hypothetical protein [Acidobacteriaceae bacterium]
MKNGKPFLVSEIRKHSKTSNTTLTKLVDQLGKSRGATLCYKPSTPTPAGPYCKLDLTLNSAAYKEQPNLLKGRVLVRIRQGDYR